MSTYVKVVHYNGGTLWFNAAAIAAFRERCEMDPYKTVWDQDNPLAIPPQFDRRKGRGGAKAST